MGFLDERTQDGASHGAGLEPGGLRDGRPREHHRLGVLKRKVGEVLVTCRHSHHVLKVRVGHADRELEGSLSHWHVLALSLQLHLQILEHRRLWHELLLLLLLLL